jgi:predicted PurR-regulated permease PerM
MRPNPTPPGETQMRIIWFALTALAVTAIIGVTVAAFWGVGKILNLLSPVLWPLAIAAVLAYLLDPAVNWLEHRGVSRTWGIIIVFTIVALVLSGVAASVIPQITKETNNLVGKIPAYTAQAQQRLSDWATRAEKAAITPPPPATPGTNAVPPTNSSPAAVPGNASTNSGSMSNSSTNTISPQLASNVHQIHNELMASATDWTGKLFAKVGAWILTQLAKATALIDVIIALILIPIYAFYFLREKRWIKSHWTNYLPIRNQRVKEEIVFILASINQYMIAFFRGQVLVSICSGVLYTIGFLCIGLDYAFLLGFLCMLLTMVPFLGSLVSFIITIVLTAMQFSDWLHPLMVFAIFSIVVSLENFFYSPRIMGNRVGMHPLVVIVAVMIGITLLGGLLGGVLAIPLAAALRVIMVRYLWKPNGTR